MKIWPCQVPLMLVPETKFRRAPALCFPEGLVKKTRHSTTPERSSLICAVAVTEADVEVVLTEAGVKVKPFNVGGVTSCWDVTCSAVGKPRAWIWLVV